MLAPLEPPAWTPEGALVVAGVFVASATRLTGAGSVRDPLWAGSVAIDVDDLRSLDERVVHGRAGAPYEPGLLALREGPVLERAVRALEVRPHVVLVDGTGRDHPRGAGIALHLGAVLDVPSVGVTIRPLVALPVEPPDEPGRSAPLMLEDELVGYALRTRRRARPVFAHAAWRTTPEVARALVLRVTRRYRTPEPIRLARHAARLARAKDEGRAPVTRS